MLYFLHVKALTLAHVAHLVHDVLVVDADLTRVALKNSHLLGDVLVIIQERGEADLGLQGQTRVKHHRVDAATW